MAAARVDERSDRAEEKTAEQFARAEERTAERFDRVDQQFVLLAGALEQQFTRVGDRFVDVGRRLGHVEHESAIFKLASDPWRR